MPIFVELVTHVPIDVLSGGGRPEKVAVAVPWYGGPVDERSGTAGPQQLKGALHTARGTPR